MLVSQQYPDPISQGQDPQIGVSLSALDTQFYEGNRSTSVVFHLKEERKARGEQGKVEQGAAVGTNSKSQLQPGEAPPFLQEANSRHEATLGQTTLMFFLLIHSEGNIEGKGGVASAWSSGSVSCQISSFISGKNRESRQSQERGSQEGEKVNVTVLVNCAIQVRSLLCFVTQFPLTWVTSTADVSIFPSTSLSAGVATQ